MLFTDDDGLDRATLAALRTTFTEMAGPDAPDLIPSEDGTAALGIVSISEAGASDVADVVTQLRADLRDDLPDGVSAQVTGPAAIQADLAAVFEGADLRLLLATAAVVAFLLLITYRSPILWVCRSPSSAWPTGWRRSSPPGPSTSSAFPGTSRR